MHSNSIFYGSLIAFLVSYFAAFLLRRLALKFNIIDTPQRRKIHQSSMPLLGGMAVFIGLCIGLVGHAPAVKAILPVLSGGFAILILNLVDDIKGLSARFRFIAECFIVGWVIFSGVKVSFLPPGFWGDLGEIIITVIWLVGVANAYNYLDGMDGLAAGSGFLAASFFSLILFATGQAALAQAALVLAGACLGFLLHNFPKARMFLGDSGSTFLGFMIAGMGLVGNWAQDNVVKISIPILIIGVPIFDMIFTTFTRVAENKVHNLMEWFSYAGRDHFHHYLVDLGLSRLESVMFIWAITFALGLSALMVSNDKGWEGALTVLQASIIFYIIGALMIAAKKRRHSGWWEIKEEKKK